jgi:hypothetical protein
MVYKYYVNKHGSRCLSNEKLKQMWDFGTKILQGCQFISHKAMLVKKWFRLGEPYKFFNKQNIHA